MSELKRRLLLVGASSFARELVSWIPLDSAEWSSFEFGGFIADATLGALPGYPEYEPGVVATVRDYRPRPGDALIMAIADPKAKLEISALLESNGASFVSFVHSSVLVARHVKIGRGVVICPRAVVSCHAEIGDFVSVNLAATVGHDARIGLGCTLSAHSDVTGFAVLEQGVFLGSHASILPKAKVGAFAKVGAGTVVLRQVIPGATVMGVPAKQILP